MWNEARIDNIFLHTPHIDEKHAKVSTQISVVAPDATSARVIITSPERAFKRTVKDVQLQAGNNTLHLDLKLKTPNCGGPMVWARPICIRLMWS
jgi:hypothetical protein